MQETAFGTTEAGERHGDEHDCLCKDDRHYAGGVNLEGDVLTGTAILTVADDALCILYGHFACSLNEKHGTDSDGKEQHDLDDEHHQTALTGCCTGQTACEFKEERSRETGDDTDKDDKRYTVADTAVCDTLAEPHDKHRAGCEDNRQIYHCPESEAHSSAVGGTVDLHLKVDQVSGSLEDEDEDCEVACVLVHLLTSALAFALHLLERRQNHAAELYHD